MAMIRIALASLAVLGLAACSATQPYGAHGPDPRLEYPAPPAAYARSAPGVVVDAAPMPLDPEPMPANIAPGECVARVADDRSYHWVRTACPSDDAAYAYRAYEGGYSYSSGQYVSQYQAAVPAQDMFYPDYGYGYRNAGRDAQGYLVWPGKVPAR